MKRALAVLAPAALVLGLAACMGADDDDGPSGTEVVEITSETETEATFEVTVPEISIPDITIPDITIPDISIPDISIPDFSIPEFSIPEFSLPDLSELTLPDNADELFADAFPNLSRDQLDCLVENLAGNFDPQEAMQLMETCDIDPADLTGG